MSSVYQKRPRCFFEYVLSMGFFYGRYIYCNASRRYKGKQLVYTSNQYNTELTFPLYLTDPFWGDIVETLFRNVFGKLCTICCSLTNQEESSHIIGENDDVNVDRACFLRINAT